MSQNTLTRQFNAPLFFMLALSQKMKMKKNIAIKIIIAFTLCSSIFAPKIVSAKNPVWTIIPTESNSQNQKVGAGKTAIQYTITNQSQKSHTVVVSPINGVEIPVSTCNLAPKGSCTVTLIIDSSKIETSGITGGPIVCEKNNPLQCYQPAQTDSLNISLKEAAGKEGGSGTNQAASIDSIGQQNKRDETNQNIDFFSDADRLNNINKANLMNLISDLINSMNDSNANLSNQTIKDALDNISNAINSRSSCGSFCM
jgi:hypothetical protein